MSLQPRDGFHCKSSASSNGGIKGAMLAVGTSIEDAEELCEMEEFAGRINVAASNSSTSVTVSGDKDAIDELQVILNDEKKFSRLLKVDQAYHSKHMMPCFDPYVEALTPSHSQCTWYSSVNGGEKMDSRLPLSDIYWAENMTKPVLFSQAIAAAVSIGPTFDVAIEVGSHPALMGPATQTIQEVLQHPIPYSGTLARGTGAIESFSNSLGFLWSHLNTKIINLSDCEIAMSGQDKQAFAVQKGLPAYQWNHEAKHWHESRKSRRMRLREKPFHPLSGHVTPDSTPHHLRWKNLLKLSELEWLEGHQVQGQIVFPAAGYVSTALEGAQFLAEGKPIQLIELRNFYIHQAVMFENDGTGVEVLIEISQIPQTAPDSINAKFTFSAAIGGQNPDLNLAADGEIRIVLGVASPSLLSERGLAPPHMIDVEQSRLYNFMESLEYNFTGPFRSLSTLQRKLGNARCVANKALTADAGSLLVHPVDLDAAFQSVMLAYSYPGDDQLRNLHLPTSIAKVRVNPAVLLSQNSSDETVIVDSTCLSVDRATPGSGFSGHVELYTNGSSHAAIQVDQVNFKPLKSSATADRNVFNKIVWVPSAPDGHLAAEGIPVTRDDTDLLWVLSRIASYFLRRFDEDVPEDSPAQIESPLCHYLNYARHMTRLLRSGEHKYAKKTWVDDRLEDVLAEVKAQGVEDNSDVQIMLLVGNTMPRAFKGETTMLEHMRESGLLDAYCAHGFGTMQSSLWLSRTTKQITDRSPHLNLLEIGAGTGGATKNILNAIGQDLDSYTFTDISSSFFENAADLFSPWKDRMIFKVCDAEKDPLAQGFTEGAYDVVIGSLVVHATAKLGNTMRNLRRLLKPGGFLIIGEGSSDGPLQSGDGFIFGALPGWWLGVDEGRNLSPFINVPQWDAILKRTGFSGIDTISPPKFLDTFGVILFVSQAIDDRVRFIREPLSLPHMSASITKLAIIGGVTETVAKAVAKLKTVLSHVAGQVIVYKRLEDVNHDIIGADTTVLSLSELDQPVFKDLTEERWHSFKKLFESERTILFLTSGRIQHEPFSNMIVGFGRSAVHELDDLRLQFLDLPDVSKIDATAVAETLMRYDSKQLEGNDILYTAEPELIVDAEGRQLVPRLDSIITANSRYNSISRDIYHKVDVSNAVVELLQDSMGSTLRQIQRYEASEDSNTKNIEIRVTHTILSALTTPVGYQFLILGLATHGQQYLAFSASLCSVLSVPEEAAVPVTVPSSSEKSFLTLAAAQLISLMIVEPLFAGQKLVIHNASQEVAEAIATQASAKAVQTVFIADSNGSRPSPSSCIKLPGFIGRSRLDRVIPSDIACFVGLSKRRSENELTILSNLPARCLRETLESISSNESVDAGAFSAVTLGQTLKKIIGLIGEQRIDTIVPSISLESLTNGEYPEDPLSLVDWTVSTTLTARVARLDIKPMFKGDKTYWLCGMSGALGISLCDWMIERGVRHLVLTSRNPKVEPGWIQNHESNGVTVKLMSCDVTQAEALNAVHKTMVDTMPPIVGALNGAMVLRDSSIRNMEFDQVLDVIKPKVLGSIHLDNIFHDVELDFFILLSSINCVIGNVGQANYAAANMGMCGVAANRRKRGLNSVAINVGAIIGIGYITQSDRQLDVTVAKMAMMHLSEEDFHQIFAEGMEAGYIDSPVGAELCTGLRDISPDSVDISKWYSNPKFARFIVHQSASNDDKKEQGNSPSIQDRLTACKTEQDVLQVIKQAFTAQLRRVLQANSSDDDLLAAHTNELGLVSLISVDIRTWFLKNFQVNIPVLKIMAADVQMSSLAELALEDIPAKLIPSVVRDQSLLDSSDGSTVRSSAVNSRLDSPASLSSASSVTTVDKLLSVEGDESSDKLDWIAEARPPVGIAISPSIAPVDKSPRVILLTGVSGLLGHHLLNALVAQPAITKVICVAVRKLSERIEAKQIPKPSERVIYYAGDLCAPRLGLSEVDAESIFAEVDAIIHNASDTSHLKYYSTLREANVGSTRQLLAYCIPRMIPFHYVSSAGVAIFAGLDAFPEISAMGSSTLPPADGSHGYMCGKWVNERLLEQVNEQYGLRVCIQRPSTIIREGDDATTTKADFDWVNALIHYSHTIQAVPKVQHSSGAFDLVYVQSVCQDIIRELLADKPRGGNGMTYVNNVGDIVIPMDRMTDIGKKKGKVYQALPMEEWGAKAIKAGLHPAVAALIETFDEPGSPPYPKLLKDRL
ncbi:hypothetical protein BDV97DRAFT_293724 [Delphinella strobiligena]|nr:hypothetical protein BDV97DRAFT_293724 [Delphinella strobiligena]